MNNTSAVNGSDYYDDLANFTTSTDQLSGWHIFVIIMYVIVILVGCIGNLIIVVVIIKNKHLHTVTNTFIVNLAISDIFLCIFNLPFGLYYQVTGQWIFGKILCHVISGSFVVPMYISTILILMIAIDRYILIVFPFRPKMTMKTAIYIIVCLTACTLGLAIPLAYFQKYEDNSIPEMNYYKMICRENWPGLKPRHAFAFSVFALQFCLPLFVSTVMYTHIYFVLKRRPLQKNDNSRNQRTNKILVAIIVVFVICWLPFNLFNIILDVNPKLLEGQYFTVADLLFRLFAVLSACINPFLYGWLNDNFRKELATMVSVASRTGQSPTNRTNGKSHKEPPRAMYSKVSTAHFEINENEMNNTSML